MKENQPNPALTPPEYFRPEQKVLFAHITTEYDLKLHHLKILIALCEALDRAAEAREAVEKDGAYQTDANGIIRKHPGIAVQRDALIVFSRLLRELDLDLEPPQESRRPPMLRSMRRGA